MVADFLQDLRYGARMLVKNSGFSLIAIISHRCWQRRFGGDPSMVGKTIELNNLRFTVVGIAPAKFSGLVRGMSCDVWVPMMMTPQMLRGDDTLESRGTRVLSVLGRLKPGITVKQAQAHFDILAAQQIAAYRQEWTDSGGKGRVITVLPESQSRIPAAALDKAIGVAGLITVVMLLVLFLACANLAGLFLARAITRQKEMAVRLALGASRWRLIRQLLSESLLVAMLGGIAGAIFAWQALSLVIGFVPPIAVDLSPDIRVLVFALSVSLATSIVFGLAPAFQATKVDLIAALKDESNLSGYRRSRSRSGLVVAQIAVSVLLYSFLIGVKTTDVLTLACVAVSLVLVALLACWIPARRATKVDPLVALRYE